MVELCHAEQHSVEGGRVRRYIVIAAVITREEDLSHSSLIQSRLLHCLLHPGQISSTALARSPWMTPKTGSIPSISTMIDSIQVFPSVETHDLRCMPSVGRWLTQLILWRSVRNRGAEHGAITWGHRVGGIFLRRRREMRNGAGNTRFLEASNVSSSWIVHLVSWLIICTSFSIEWPK